MHKMNPVTQNEFDPVEVFGEWEIVNRSPDEVPLDGLNLYQEALLRQSRYGPVEAAAVAAMAANLGGVELTRRQLLQSAVVLTAQGMGGDQNPLPSVEKDSQITAAVALWLAYNVLVQVNSIDDPGVSSMASKIAKNFGAGYHYLSTSEYSKAQREFENLANHILGLAVAYYANEKLREYWDPTAFSAMRSAEDAIILTPGNPISVGREHIYAAGSELDNHQLAPTRYVAGITPDENYANVRDNGENFIGTMPGRCNVAYGAYVGERVSGTGRTYYQFPLAEAFPTVKIALSERFWGALSGEPKLGLVNTGVVSVSYG